MSRIVLAFLTLVSVMGFATAQERSDPKGRYVLAVSWQPAFCEGQSRRPECRSQTADRADATRFSLHGLWPQPRRRDFCEAENLRAIDKAGWDGLPAPELSADTRRRLDEAMPGSRSHLDRHEWAKHGTCYGGNAEEYFTESIALLDAINASPVGRLFAGRIGREITADEVRAAFDEAFGKGAGERVRLSCRNDGGRRLVNELTIGLAGEVAATPDLKALIMASRSTKPGCPGGVVDPAGLQ